MRIAGAIVTVSLLAVLGVVQVSSASATKTKYKPCSLLSSVDIETAFGEKVTTGPGGMLEDEYIEKEGPLQGQPQDFCLWKLKRAVTMPGEAGPGGMLKLHGDVTLYVHRAFGPLPQLASFWYSEPEEMAKSAEGKVMGVTVESVRLPGAECRIFKNVKAFDSSTIVHFTSCIVASKGVALLLLVSSVAKAPVAAQPVKKLLDRASSRLP